MTDTNNNLPFIRVYAVSDLPKDNNKHEDWVEIGALFRTKNPGILSLAKKSHYDLLIDSDDFKLMYKLVTPDNH